MNQRTVLITGASSGIGAACAALFAERGCSLVLVARRLERLEKQAVEIRERFGVEVDVARVDVADRAAVESFALEKSEWLARVDVLVNNAGLAQGFGAFQDAKPEHWETMLDTNVAGLMAFTRALLPHFLKRGEGHIVNLGSIAGRWIYPGGHAYCASKAAVHAFSQGLRMDLAGTGIRVTEVSPGKVETEFSFVRLGDPAKARAVYEGYTPLTAHDVAESIVWAVERPARVNIQEIVIYPTDQASPTLIKARQTKPI